MEGVFPLIGWAKREARMEKEKKRQKKRKREENSVPIEDVAVSSFYLQSIVEELKGGREGGQGTEGIHRLLDYCIHSSLPTFENWKSFANSSMSMHCNGLWSIDRQFFSYCLGFVRFVVVITCHLMDHRLGTPWPPQAALSGLEIHFPVFFSQFFNEVFRQSRKNETSQRNRSLPTRALGSYQC